MNPTSGNPPGFYGKLPSQGDFVSRRVTRDFVFYWDGWLQTVMAAGRASLGGQWQEVYLTSPIWRFVLSPGVCGEAAYAGIMMPSIDRVGRYFPLTVAAPLPAWRFPLSVAYVCRDWFELVEQQVLSVLEDEPPSLDEFDHGVQRVPFPTSRQAPFSDDSSGPAFDGRGQQRSISVDGISVGGASCHMLERALQAEFPNYSVWWTEGSDSTAPSMLVTENLPNVQRYQTMLEGVRDGDDAMRVEPLANRNQPPPPAPQAVEAYAEAPAPTSSMMPPPDDDVTTVTFDTDPGFPAVPDQPLVEAAPDPADMPSISDILSQPVNSPMPTADPGAPVDYHSGAVTSTGKVRRVNEDAMLQNSLEGLWLVADGMGGHAGGQVASRAVVECVTNSGLPPDLNGKVHMISRALHAANRRLLNHAIHNPSHKGLGSTVAALVTEDRHSAIVWVGDTRVYRQRGDVLEQLTADHSEQQERLARGDIGALLSPRNVITRAIGGHEQLQLEVIEQEVLPGDRFVLCSDGVYEAMTHDELRNLLNEQDPHAACTGIIARVDAGRAEDNATVIVVDADARS